MTNDNEIKAISDEVLAAVISDEHYRAGIIDFIKVATEEGDIDTLRVYRNLTLHEKFHPAKLTMKYANYAMICLHDFGYEETASILTPETLYAFEAVVRARQKALDGREWIMGDGNDKLLLELIERPKSGPILLHLLQDRGITDVDQLLTQTTESLKVATPLHEGTL